MYCFFQIILGIDGCTETFIVAAQTSQVACGRMSLQMSDPDIIKPFSNVSTWICGAIRSNPKVHMMTETRSLESKINLSCLVSIRG